MGCHLERPTRAACAAALDGELGAFAEVRECRGCSRDFISRRAADRLCPACREARPGVKSSTTMAVDPRAARVSFKCAEEACGRLHPAGTPRQFYDDGPVCWPQHLSRKRRGSAHRPAPCDPGQASIVDRDVKPANIVDRDMKPENIIKPSGAPPPPHRSPARLDELRAKLCPPIPFTCSRCGKDYPAGARRSREGVCASCSIRAGHARRREAEAAEAEAAEAEAAAKATRFDASMDESVAAARDLVQARGAATTTGPAPDGLRLAGSVEAGEALEAIAASRPPAPPADWPRAMARPTPAAAILGPAPAPWAAPAPPARVGLPVLAAELGAALATAGIHAPGEAVLAAAAFLLARGWGRP